MSATKEVTFVEPEPLVIVLMSMVAFAPEYVVPLTLPDAAVAGMGVAPGAQLLAHNSSPGSRATLDLSQSADGRQWQRVQTLATGAPLDEFSYPAMAWVDGALWVSYTVDRQRIAWQRMAARPVPKEGTP